MNKPQSVGMDALDYQERDGGGITPLQVFHAMWNRRRLFFTVAIFIIVIGLVVLQQKVPRYTATSSVMIGIAKSQVVDIEAVISGIGAGNYLAIAAELAVLRSSGLARKVVEKFELDNLPEFNPSLRPPSLKSYLNPVRYFPDSWKPDVEAESEPASDSVAPVADDANAVLENQGESSLSDYISDSWKLALGSTPVEVLSDEERAEQRINTATGIFMSKLSITPASDYSSVVNVSFESLDPALAARIANEIPEAYIIGQLEAKFEATEKATSWLNDQLAELKIKVEESEQAVQAYREQYDFTEVKGGEIVVEQLSAINSQVIIARAERAQAEARLRQIRKLSSGSGNAIETATEVLSSATIQRLSDEEAVAARKAADLATEYGAKHPKMIQAKAEVVELRRRIKQEIEKVVAGLKNEVEVARIRENSLSGSLKEVKQATGQFNKESVQLRALEREAAANRALFETFLTRFKETSSTSGLQEADARVISVAGPGSQSYPNKRRATLLIVFGGLAFAAALVLLLHALTPGLTSPEQMEQQLGLPAIGLIPQVKGANPADYALDKPHSSYGEALNSLRTALILSNPDDAVKAIQITSSIPEEGKSTLALSFARLLTTTALQINLLQHTARNINLMRTQLL